ncbi:4Fe-4S dicluster domain-containing protein [Geomonas sp. Red32]|uniref:4Fe-4S dicluster domain-containing protein n=1 Tax=Geomonas sp. Red32 TaxID=2912856 RepID=UPI00202CCA72|nr:4Fe-4S dicluster domain-containing protein [Geomonas sp. Red32]MCM0080901.1 4Fe-4S dicluster domain-containing protein [Geomonas sp. Red32]
MSTMSRRTFLWLASGTGFALASNPPRKLVNKLIPQVIPPEDIRPGEWALFATTCRECPAGCGMHLWHRDGRVTKAEGNPSHPVNRGGLCARGQSSLQGLYDPDRLTRVVRRVKGEREREATWEEALEAVAGSLKGGGRAAVLSNLQTGALAEVMKGFAGAFGGNRLLFYEPFNYEALRVAHQKLFGRAVIPDYRLETSNFILSLSADFLETWVSPVSFASQFAAMHAYRGGRNMNRFAYIGPRLSMTAANADTFIQVPAGHERVLAAAMLKIIVEKGWHKNDLAPVQRQIDALLAAEGPVTSVSPHALEELTRAFTSARSPVVLAGPVGATGATAVDTALCAGLLNYAAGTGAVDFAHPHALSSTATEAEVASLLASLGPQDVLFIHDCNPVFTRPGVIAQLERVGTVVYLGAMMDETAKLAQWVLPIDYPLESWGDYSPSAGIEGIMQPAMGRLYDTRMPGDIFLDLARRGGRALTRGTGAAPAGFEEWLRRRWSGVRSGVGEESFWTTALRNGGVWKSPATGATLPASPGIGSLTFAPPVTPPAQSDTVELWAWPSIMLFDGRTANRGWLQEAPDPTTFIVWGNWIDLHPLRARSLGIRSGDLAELTTSFGTLQAPVRITQEISDGMAGIAFGQGHAALGRNAAGIGANPFQLLPGAAGASPFGRCRIRRAGPCGEDFLVRTAPAKSQIGREIAQWIPLSRLSEMAPGQGDELILPLPEGYRNDKDMYPKREYTKHRWAMVVDLQRCIGCGACAVACYAENNIAVIGREKVGNGREMAWLRVPPYRKPGSPLRLGWLPLLCQHCDAAPCEPVCPVFAAMHNEEGLNAQIYNRCIGTRYCSNNCPYKVRRFNWINIKWHKPLDLQLNPEVTVRTRGVMEKCTFCVQRIRQAEYRAVREKRAVRDGEIQPACAQSCPARVYTFGDLLDPNSEVSRLTRTDPRRYHVLEELNTKPAVTFLRRVDIDG